MIYGVLTLGCDLETQHGNTELEQNWLSIGLVYDDLLHVLHYTTWMTWMILHSILNAYSGSNEAHEARIIIFKTANLKR